MMPHETLEGMLVQREKVVSRIVELVRDSVLGDSKHHTLAIGPRGIGKTHLVSLVYHRVCQMDDLKDRLRIAWLREEEWGVSSLLDVLIRILRSLAEEYKDDGLRERIEALYANDPDTAQYQAGDLLKEYVAGRTLLVLTENLDETFAGLGEKGQQDLRAYLQENPFSTILATAQSLFNGVRRRTFPFYGFFRIEHLEKLTFNEATELLARIATLRGDDELASFVRTPAGRARIRAVHHLAGGNHRVYVIFSHFLTRDSLDSLVDAVMKMLEELTPYYQSRMMTLAPLQRKIVEHLCSLRGAAPVKEIARRCFKTSQTVSAQFGILHEKGYVQTTHVGRESYCELREPLMRICMEVKRHDGAPVRLLVDFLRIWYSCEELQGRLSELGSGAMTEWRYLSAAIEVSKEEMRDPRLAACQRDYDDCLDRGDGEGAFQAAEEALAIDEGACEWCMYGIALGYLGRHDEALDSFDKAMACECKDKYGPLARRGQALLFLERYDEAVEACNGALEIHCDDPRVWETRGRAFLGLHRHEDALDSFDKALELKPKDAFLWHMRGEALMFLDRLREAVLAWEKAMSLDGTRHAPAFRRAMFLTQYEWDQGIVALEEALTNHPVPQPAEFACPEVILRQLLFNASWRASWVERAAALVEVYGNHGLLSILGTGLTHSLRTLTDEVVTNTTAQAWVELWRECSEDKEELALALRLLEATVQYKCEPDERILLALPDEERRILIDMLDLDDEEEQEEIRN